MPIKMIRMMDSYCERLEQIDTHRLQDVRHAATRLAAEIDKVLKEREAEPTKVEPKVSASKE